MGAAIRRARAARRRRAIAARRRAIAARRRAIARARAHRRRMIARARAHRRRMIARRRAIARRIAAHRRRIRNRLRRHRRRFRRFRRRFRRFRRRFSDRTLKTDIQRVGTSNAGIPIYTFRYINEGSNAPLYRGVMAQDLLEIPELNQFKDAVSKTESGKYEVDYSKLDVDMELAE